MELIEVNEVYGVWKKGEKCESEVGNYGYFEPFKIEWGKVDPNHGEFIGMAAFYMPPGVPEGLDTLWANAGVPVKNVGTKEIQLAGKNFKASHYFVDVLASHVILRDTATGLLLINSKDLPPKVPADSDHGLYYPTIVLKATNLRISGQPEKPVKPAPIPTPSESFDVSNCIFNISASALPMSEVTTTSGSDEASVLQGERNIMVGLPTFSFTVSWPEKCKDPSASGFLRWEVIGQGWNFLQGQGVTHRWFGDPSNPPARMSRVALGPSLYFDIPLQTNAGRYILTIKATDERGISNEIDVPLHVLDCSGFWFQKLGGKVNRVVDDDVAKDFGRTFTYVKFAGIIPPLPAPGFPAGHLITFRYLDTNGALIYEEPKKIPDPRYESISPPSCRIWSEWSLVSIVPPAITKQMPSTFTVKVFFDGDLVLTKNVPPLDPTPLGEIAKELGINPMAFADKEKLREAISRALSLPTIPKPEEVQVARNVEHETNLEEVKERILTSELFVDLPLSKGTVRIGSNSKVIFGAKAHDLNIDGGIRLIKGKMHLQWKAEVPNEPASQTSIPPSEIKGGGMPIGGIGITFGEYIANIKGTEILAEVTDDGTGILTVVDGVVEVWKKLEPGKKVTVEPFTQLVAPPNSPFSAVRFGGIQISPDGLDIRINSGYQFSDNWWTTPKYVQPQPLEGEKREKTSPVTTPPSSGAGGGCLIATAAFGSELTPQVQFLRNFRDNHILSTAAGSSFMNVFNMWYYSFSPYVADAERQDPVLQQTMKYAIYPLLGILTVAEKAYSALNGEVGAVTAGFVTSSMIGFVYFWPIAYGITRIRKRQLHYKVMISAILISLIGVITGILIPNPILLMITTSAFVVTILGISSLISVRLINRIISKWRRF